MHTSNINGNYTEKTYNFKISKIFMYDYESEKICTVSVIWAFLNTKWKTSQTEIRDIPQRVQDWRVQYRKDVSCFKILSNFNAVSIKIL